jgi:hypothetical protein
MQKVSHSGEQLPVNRSLLSLAVAGVLLSGSFGAQAAVVVKGIVAGSYFTAPVISNIPFQTPAVAGMSTPSSTVASVYQNAKVCFDLNDNGACDANEPYGMTASNGNFEIAGATLAPLAAEISTASTNNGNPVASRTVFRASTQEITAASVAEHTRAGGTITNIAVTPLTTEVLRSIENDGLSYAAARTALAGRLGVDDSEVLADPNTVTDPVAQKAILTESTILTNRWTLAAKFVDRQDPNVTPAQVANNPLVPFGGVTAPAVTIPQAQEAAMNIEGIPRYDHVFIIMLENKGTQTIKGSPYAPKINGYLNSGNQFTSYFATGNPSEPNYTALGGADDFGITDDNQWNCGATGVNAVQDTFQPTSNQPGLASSPFTAPCNQATNHNITGRQNLFNALASNGMTWRTYSESMNPGQDFRTDSVADASVTAPDHLYQPGTLNGNTSVIGSSTLNLGIPAGLYKTKHHPGMAYQNVRSAPEFLSSNRTIGGGQWDAALLQSKKYAIPANYNVDQFSSDLQSGDIGNLNFIMPDQCDDMHSITVTGIDSATGKSGTASDCGGNQIITRGDNYTDSVIKKIQASPIWNNPAKRVAVVIMFDEGTATSGFNGCCGWVSYTNTKATPLVQNPDGTFSADSSIVNYVQGNHGHGESIFGLLNNQASAPKGLMDSDYYSHFSFVRTLQDMFGLADPDNNGSYMNRSKYTQAFIAANILNLPEYANSADTHFDSVRPMNHAFVIPAGYKEKQSTDISVNTPAQIGPDATQTNLWSLK